MSTGRAKKWLEIASKDIPFEYKATHFGGQKGSMIVEMVK